MFLLLPALNSFRVLKYTIPLPSRDWCTLCLSFVQEMGVDVDMSDLLVQGRSALPVKNHFPELIGQQVFVISLEAYRFMQFVSYNWCTVGLGDCNFFIFVLSLPIFLHHFVLTLKFGSSRVPFLSHTPIQKARKEGKEGEKI